jgi:hypothetical protein
LVAIMMSFGRCARTALDRLPTACRGVAAMAPIALALVLGACSSDVGADIPTDAKISQDIDSGFQNRTDDQSVVQPGGPAWPLGRGWPLSR